jgi:hypothetical protein
LFCLHQALLIQALSNATSFPQRIINPLTQNLTQQFIAEITGYASPVLLDVQSFYTFSALKLPDIAFSFISNDFMSMMVTVKIDSGNPAAADFCQRAYNYIDNMRPAYQSLGYNIIFTGTVTTNVIEVQDMVFLLIVSFMILSSIF